ncbi:Myc-type, basic helix-loop-helix (bHLH) domain [Dillenia turbinata]|uniref:Myc-type, basic helix-loop-helix (BHLH) domain n=1 Tax=Dillenia turbinata TaxID=194707 RepID=A0AAN8YXE6_9MAGN
MFQGGERGSFLWETQSFAFSNSDDSGDASEKKSSQGLMMPGSSSNSPTAGASSEAAAAAVPTGKKRGQNGVLKKGKSASVNGGDNNEGKITGGESDDHETHIWTERERRKKMRNMFSNLHALLPQLPPKADKSTIVDEAVNYITTLQHTLQKLQKQKLERQQRITTINYEPSVITAVPKLGFESREAFLADQVSSTNMAITPTNPNSNNSFSTPPKFPILFQTWTSSNVILSVCGDDAQISVCSPMRPGLLSAICCALEKHQIEVVSAHISSDYNRCMYMIKAHVSL